MPKNHTVTGGECLSSIAFQYGFFPDTLWAAPENSALRGKRTDPNVLQAGDVVVIPDVRAGEAECATGKRHTFRRRGVPEKLRLQFFSAGEPRADEEYELTVDGKRLGAGARTDAEGRVEHFIRPDARVATFRFPETGEELVFALGGIDPVDTVKGVQGRLKSLGFFAGDIDGAEGEALALAVATYQAARGLPPTGQIDDPTRAELSKDYGA